MLMWGLYIDPLYIVLFIFTLALSGAAQAYIRRTFARWDAVANSAGLAGAQVGQELVRRASFGGASGSATGISFKVTYVAAAVTSILTLLYYLSLARR